MRTRQTQEHWHRTPLASKKINNKPKYIFMFTEQERLKITYEIKHYTDEMILHSFVLLRRNWLSLSLVLRRIKTYGFIFIYLCPRLLLGLNAWGGFLCCISFQIYIYHINESLDRSPTTRIYLVFPTGVSLVFRF